jgi:hypothetical protein
MPSEEGNGVEQREGQHREQRSAGEPLELLAQQRRVGAAVAAQEEHRGQDEEGGDVGGRDLVEAELEVKVACQKRNAATRRPTTPTAGRIDEGSSQRRLHFLQTLFREDQGEVQEEGGLQASASDVAPVDGPVEQSSLPV